MLVVGLLVVRQSQSFKKKKGHARYGFFYRANKDTREKPTKPAVEPSTHEHQVEMSDPNSSPSSVAYVVEKPQKNQVQKNCVHRVESPMAVKFELPSMGNAVTFKISDNAREIGKVGSSFFLAGMILVFEVCILGTQHFQCSMFVV